MRIAVLVKQVPAFEAMEIGPDGRLVREGLTLEMNPYCRRAVSKGVELARATAGTSTVFTLGPPAAEDTLREALAWGVDDGVLVSGPAFAGSDTLATARALAAAVGRLGPFDLVLVGRNSVDADTGQVGPEVAELLGLPFVAGVKRLELRSGLVPVLDVTSEEDDGYSERTISLPALLSTAERLTEPAKIDAAGRAAVPASRLRVLGPDDLGPGPWGQEGSGTYVGEVRVLTTHRDGKVLDGPIGVQVGEAVRLLVERGSLGVPAASAPEAVVARPVPMPAPAVARSVAVLIEPERSGLARELLGAAAALAAAIRGRVVAVLQHGAVVGPLSEWGADELVVIEGAEVEEDVAAAVVAWAGPKPPWAVLAPGTMWGREVAGRSAAALGAGLTGDAVDLEVDVALMTGEARLQAWKPAFGGGLVAAVYASTPVQMVTVRPGVLSAPPPRPAPAWPLPSRTIRVAPRGRVTVTARRRDDDVGALVRARRVVCVGAGVSPQHYGEVGVLVSALGAEIGATRKVTDNGWLPRARQVGITGRSIAPELYIGLGLSGKFNHMVGVRGAGTVLAVNPDREAPLWDHVDVGIVGDWREAVPVLAEAVAAASTPAGQ